ncbi:hypothetical protein F5I97DRAFT_1923732 [Phlebopus sp. FC_14]|nr:hypothetical protein F5I97DRAFT_1923732 [Phlebopus sp. FC_14]
MDNPAFAFYTNVFGIIVGSVSLITLAFGFHVNLPSNRMKTLEILLDETDKIFNSALEDGLLPEQEFIYKVKCHLYQLREDTMLFRLRVYCVTTWLQDCKELLKGLSVAIGKTCYELRKLRAAIVTSSEAQRRNLCATRDATTSSASLPSHIVISMDSNPMTDHTNSNASSIATSELTENTIAEGSECNDEGESFTTAEDLSDAVPNLSAQLMERVSPEWRRIWKHSSKHAINPGSHDRVHEVDVGQVPGTKTCAICLSGYPPDAVPTLSAQLTERVSPDWRRIWKHGSKHAMNPRLMIASTESMDKFPASKLDAWVATTHSTCPHRCARGSYSW